MEEVYDALAGKDVASVEEIHTALENALMWYNKDAARNYIEYRSMRDASVSYLIQYSKV